MQCCTVLALFDLSHTLAAPLLSGVEWPWQALDGLADLRNQYLESAQKERRRKRIQKLQKLYRRLSRAFPRMKSLRNPEAFRELLAQMRVSQAATRIKQHIDNIEKKD